MPQNNTLPGVNSICSASVCFLRVSSTQTPPARHSAYTAHAAGYSTPAIAASVSTATISDSAVSGATAAGTRHFSVSTAQPQNNAATAKSTQSSSIEFS